MAPPSIPRATYRLQLHAGFTFADAEAIVPYLAELGVSHLYLSPFLKARPGSTHGYDIVDHNALNPEIGDMGALESLHAALKARGMGIVMDLVPNHMGIGGGGNAWWQDVLEWGEDSPYARYFDIDWNPARRELKGKVLLPVLGDHYGAVLERGELALKLDARAGTLAVWYWENWFPIALKDYAGLLQPVLDDIALDFRGLGNLRKVEARRQKSIELKARLAGLVSRPGMAEAVAEKLALPIQDLHALLERQSYRLSYWRVAADEINYRRFFDINDLAALRMVEEPELFERAHRLTFDLVRRGIVDGLRVDHVDGLFNPADYCRKLQEGAGHPYLVVEKILAHHEPIRRDWPVAGATGYGFINLVGGLFVDHQGEAALSAAYAAFIGFDMDFEAQVTEAKKRIIDEHMASELRVLAGRLGRIAAGHWRSRDFTVSGLYTALKEVVACLPVYRTYVTSRRVTDNDRRYIHWAVAKARKLSGGDPSYYDFLAAVLDTSIVQAGYSARAVVDFTMRLQQYSGPVMAKGFEDTALYRFNRLISLNEVGGEPTRFGVSPSGFHQANRLRARTHPHSMLATATHDTKRGEDVRVRISVLSELPEEWRNHVERWSQLNAPFRRQLDSGPAPEPNDEFFLYQTLVGAWTESGDFCARLAAAMLKSVREAKRRTSWAHPDEEYEAAVAEFIHRICETGRRNPFLDDFLAFRDRLLGPGMLNGLAQTLLKLTAPGVPDIYQGCELWDLSLVDPDNRRPVDYALRRSLLGRPLTADSVSWCDGAVKQELIRRALDLRRRRPALLADGAYRPLAVHGARAAHVLAFARQDAESTVVVAVPLLTARLWPDGHGMPPLGAAWKGNFVDAPRGAGGFRDLLADRDLEPVSRRGAPVLPVTELFARFPLALLEAR